MNIKDSSTQITPRWGWLSLPHSLNFISELEPSGAEENKH
jgi:hypothetical protein